jgi:hypothetical protein
VTLALAITDSTTTYPRYESDARGSECIQRAGVEGRKTPMEVGIVVERHSTT